MARTILIVDDIKLNREMLKRILGGDYEYLEAENGELAMEILRRDYAVISAVLLDLSMPVMDGFAVLEQMHTDSVLSLIPVIVMTGSAVTDAEVTALTKGASDFVIKPYNPPVIVRRIRNLIKLRETAATVNALQKDRLTGLLNREAFFDRMGKLVKAGKPGDYVLVSLNINGFKTVNDQYGTEAGDSVLKHIASRIERVANETKCPCSRIAADNFALLYPAQYADSELLKIAKAEISAPDSIDRPIGMRIGRYAVDDLSLTPNAMYDRAVMAELSVKGRYETDTGVYVQSMGNELLRRQRIVNEMDSALADRQFEVWLQPQFNHSTGALIGSEALVRWRHPEKGLIAPNVFIPIFEQNGFIYEVDKFVWCECCRMLRGWIDAGLAPLPISVNISRYDVFRADFVEVIVGLLKKYNLPTELLRLEITESAFSESAEQIVMVVERLINYGFTVEIDDFGSGYSSLNTLKDVAAQVLKLDMRFLESSNNTQRGGNIIESVVRMASWLGMSVIAEGVETLQQADYLKSIGCSYVQGYLYSKPLPVAEFVKLVSGVSKEERLMSMVTVRNLNNNSFWDPSSMDTLIFNSYIGGACIFEYHNGGVEMLRVNDKLISVLGSVNMTAEDILRLRWSDYLGKAERESMLGTLENSDDGDENIGEYMFENLPGCERHTYLRLSTRVIAATGKRKLIYCTAENTTVQRQAEKREHEAEQKRKAAAEQLQAIMDNIDCGVTAAYYEGGRLHHLFANDRFYGMLGCTREYYAQHDNGGLSAVHPDDARRVTEFTRKTSLDGRPGCMEFRIIRSDGKTVWLRNNMRVISLAGVDAPVLISVSADITAQRETDAQIRFLNDVARDLLAQPDTDMGVNKLLGKLLEYFCGNRAYIFEFDFAKRTTDNTYEVCAPGVGAEKQNLQNVPFEVISFWLHAFDRLDYVNIADVNALGDDRPEKATLQAQGINSLIAVPLYRDGALLGFIGIDDPTAHKSHVQSMVALGDYVAVMLTRRDLNTKIRDDNETLTRLMNDTPGGFVRLRQNDDGSIVPVYFNAGFCKLVDMSEEELFGLYALDAYAGVCPDDVGVVSAAVKRMVEDGEATSDKYRLRHGSDDYVWVQFFGRKNKNKDGSVFFNIYYTDAGRQDEFELRRRELLDNLPFGVGICEISGEAIRMTYLNRRYRSYFKHREFDSVRDSVYDAVHPDDRAKLRAAIRPAFARGGEGSCTVRITDGEGGYRAFRLVGAAMGYNDNRSSIYVAFIPEEEKQPADMA